MSKDKPTTFTLSQYTCLALNTVGLLSNLATLYVVHFVFYNPYAQAFGGHFQYLTIIGLSIATIAFAVNIIRVFSPTALELIYDIVYHIATPLEAIISVLYWTMVLCFGPELLVPKEIEPIPLIFDLGLHLFSTIILWIDLFFFKPQFQRSWTHFVYIYGFVFFYYGWSYYCKTRNGVWPYPFLNDFPNAWARFSFYFISGTVSWFMYETGAYLHASIYRKKVKAE